MKVLEIIWHDAHSEGVQGGTWFDKTQIANTPYPVTSVGFLIEGSKDGHITLSQSVASNDGLLDSVLHVPIGMIQSMKELSE